MATSYGVYPSLQSHFMRSPNSSFCGGGWTDTPSQHVSAPVQPSLSPATPRRPKLSLNTACSLSLGRTSGLRLDTLSAVSPTVRNTYANGFEESQHNIQSATNVARLILPKVTAQHPSRLENCVSAEDSVNIEIPTTFQGATTLDFGPTEVASNMIIKNLTQTQAVPYIHPSNLRSILANSPLLEHSLLRRAGMSAIAPASIDCTPILVKRKRVSFADQLVEEISTATYVARHSDLRSRSRSPIPGQSIVTASLDVEVASSSTSTVIYHGESKPSRTIKLSRKHDEVDDDDERNIPQTPIGGRNKRQRDWVWTLGPVEHETTHPDPQQPRAEPLVVEEPTTECSADTTSCSITSQVLDALMPSTAICEAVKDMASSNGIVTSVREIVDGYFALSK